MTHLQPRLCRHHDVVVGVSVVTAQPALVFTFPCLVVCNTVAVIISITVFL